MTTYVVGDIQGCFEPFKQLLKNVAFNPTTDVLWSVGDLINRGPNNIDTLRWFYNHQACVKVVLGNHDLHLLATYAGAGIMSDSDNFSDILEAPDAPALLAWLRQQPLVYRESGYVLVHAGIPPMWSTQQAADYAQEVTDYLQGATADYFYHAMYGNEPACWSRPIKGLARLRLITNYLTRMRYCTPSGYLDMKSKGVEPTRARLSNEPVDAWFHHANQLQATEQVLFGHWAALEGQTTNAQCIALDTGCVWGGSLTFLALETGERFQSLPTSAQSPPNKPLGTRP